MLSKMVYKSFLPLAFLLVLGLSGITCVSYKYMPYRLDAQNATTKLNVTSPNARSLAVVSAGTFVTKTIFNFIMQAVRTFAFINPFTIVSILTLIPTLLRKFWRARQVNGFPFFAIPFEIVDFIRDHVYLSNFDPDSVHFQLYDKQYLRSRSLRLTDVSVTKNKLFFLTHGWMQDTADSDWMNELAETLIAVYPESNVVFVDWAPDAYKYLYPFSAYRTKAVGEVVAMKILDLEHRFNFFMDKIVLIGYGLGAHVFGMAGKYINSYSDHSLPLIVGLDPAGFLFQNFRASKRIAATDADVVMIIHTSGDVGFTKDCGSIDLYANGGLEQPGCNKYSVLCHHRRSIDLFTQALNYPHYFNARMCENDYDYENDYCLEDYINVGDLQETKTGRYYFETTGTTPYYIQNTSSVWNLWGVTTKVKAWIPIIG